MEAIHLVSHNWQLEGDTQAYRCVPMHPDSGVDPQSCAGCGASVSHMMLVDAYLPLQCLPEVKTALMNRILTLVYDEWQAWNAAHPDQAIGQEITR